MIASRSYTKSGKRYLIKKRVRHVAPLHNGVNKRFWVGLRHAVAKFYAIYIFELGITQGPTPRITDNLPTAVVDVRGLQRCQITNPSENPVAIYSDMTDDSNLSVFLMPS